MQISYGIVSNAHVRQLIASLQGTILDPILFIIYIYEISSNLHYNAENGHRRRRHSSDI